MKKRIFIFAILISVIIFSYHYFELSTYLNLEYIQNQRLSIIAQYNKMPLLFISVFLITYILVTALSIPGATIMTLLAGMLFGTAQGTIIVSFASSIGATCAMLIARNLFQNFFLQRFKQQLTTINAGIEKDGNMYLFALRLTPLFPFFIVNIVFGLTQFSAKKFFLISQIGMLPATIIYVFAGHQIATLTQVSDILSPTMIILLSVIGFFPILTKKLIYFLREKQGEI